MKEFKKIILKILLSIIIITMVVIIIDPFFHYHRPLKYINYTLLGNEQRYINNGIAKNFDYDTIITGSSMTENFSVTQFNNLLKKNAIKLPFSGATYYEIRKHLERFTSYNKDIKVILQGLDYNKIDYPSNYTNYYNFPEYLYDKKLQNDYKYILSRGAFFQSLINIINSFKNKKKINFDEYSSWRNKPNGKDVILCTYKRKQKKNGIEVLTVEEIQILKENIKKNILELPKKYPNIKFIYFITPYSIVYWDSINQNGEILKQLEAEKIMIEMILEVPNIELYSFFNNYELITNLDNYTDAGHYSYKINDKILEWISQGEYRLTKDNYEEYLENNKEFYLNYDYDKIFEK